MAVLSEPIDDTHESGGELFVAVSVDSPKVHSRIAAALAGGNLNATLLRVTDPGELAELAIDSDTIVVLVCDVDLPAEMAALRAPAPRRCASRRSSSSPRPRPGPACAAPSTPAPTRSSSSPSSSRPWPSRSAPSATASRWSRASCGPASSGPPSPTASARSSTYVSQGLTNAQIAERLFLSESTIKSHLSSAFAKFGVRSRRRPPRSSSSSSRRSIGADRAIAEPIDPTPRRGNT